MARAPALLPLRNNPQSTTPSVPAPGTKRGNEFSSADDDTYPKAFKVGGADKRGAPLEDSVEEKDHPLKVRKEDADATLPTPDSSCNVQAK